jgi:hypothetical protein
MVAMAEERGCLRRLAITPWFRLVIDRSEAVKTFQRRFEMEHVGHTWFHPAPLDW